MGTTSASTWKRAESFAAALFGAKRKPLSGATGRDDDDGSDSTHPRLHLETKLRQKSAIWSLWRKTRDKAAQFPRIFQGGTKAPVLVIREKYQEGMLIVVHSDNFYEAAMEYVAALPHQRNLEFEAGVRVRRKGLLDADPGTAEGAEGRD